MNYDTHGPQGQNPYPQQHYQGAGFRPRESNGMGIAGLIVSIVGLLLTCGVLCPIGLLLSLIGLMRQPRGEAIAGTIIGGIGTLGIVAFGAFMMLTVAATGNAINELANEERTRVAIYEAEAEIEQYRFDNDTLPEGVEGNKLILHHTDAWGTSLRYDLDGESFQIRSAGRDMIFDTDDDLTEDDYMNSYDSAEYSDEADDTSFDSAFEEATAAEEEEDFNIDLE